MSEKKRHRYREDDLLGRYPPVEMDNPEEFLLTDEEWEQAWHHQRQASFPDLWFTAERKLRSDRVARTMLMARSPTSGDDRGEADLPDEHDVALQLLEEALPHLPEELAEQVRQFLEK